MWDLTPPTQYIMAKNTQAATMPAPATTEPTTPVVNIAKPIEPTSPKLDELRAKKLEFKKLARTFEPDSDEENNALMEAYKVEQLIKAEIAGIKTAEAQMELQTKRNERVQLFDNAIALYDAMNASGGEQSAIDAYNTAAEIVVNILIGTLATKLTPAKVTGNKTEAPAGGDILTAHIANIATGMDDSASRKALETAGHKRSTVWHTVNNYNKSK